VIILKPTPLTRADFAPYGDVIDFEGETHFPINQGYAERFHDLAEVDAESEAGMPIISLLRCKPRPRPIVIDMMERHPLGSQAFYPLQDRDWLVVVADPQLPLDATTLRAFHANGRQGVNYLRNVWHFPLLVLEPFSEFLIIDRKGPGDNLEEAVIADKVVIEA
jgi:ureidoglycolate lyase